MPGLESVFRSDVPGLSAQVNVPETGQRFYRVVWLSAPLADTLTDFQGVQNHNGWQYGYAQPATSPPGSPNWFVPLPTYSEGRWVVNSASYWTYIGRDSLRPNGTITTGGKLGIEQWPVIRWTATTTTRVRVNFNVLKLEDGVGNGMVLRLYHNGQQIGSNNLLAEAGGGGLGPLVEVTEGDQLDFALDPKESDDLGDEASYRIRITPE